jgi:hypothetical protein
MKRHSSALAASLMAASTFAADSHAIDPDFRLVRFDVARMAIT